MSDQRTLLLTTLEERRRLYGHMRVRLAAVRHAESIHPLAIVFSAAPSADAPSVADVKDYGDYLFVDDHINLSQFKAWMRNVGKREMPLPIRAVQIVVPVGMFRSVREGPEYGKELLEVVGHHGSLGNDATRLLVETRSYPDSPVRAWPTRTFLLEYRPARLSARSDMFDAPLPLRTGLPVLPNLREALDWWFGTHSAYDENYVRFHFPDYTARILAAKLGRNRLVLSIQASDGKPAGLLVKYYARHADGEVSVGTAPVGDSGTCSVAVGPNLRSLHLVLTDSAREERRIDYRDVSFGSWGGSKLDYEVESDDLELRIAQGEDEVTEFKVEVDEKAQEFLESVCSFSNTYGGLIIIGVDNSGNKKGLSSQRVADLKDKIQKQVRDWIEPVPAIRMEAVSVKDKQLLVVAVPRGQTPPYNYSDHGFYIRARSTDRRASRDELLSLVTNP